MKKRIAISLVALMLVLSMSSALALVAEGTAAAKSSPVYINRMTVSDPYLSSLSVSNWGASLSGVTYGANAQVFFLAEIVVASQKDTDSPLHWGEAINEATLSFTSPNNAVNFSSANVAFFGQINGYNMNMQSVTKNMYVTGTKAEFTLNTEAANNFQGLYVAPSAKTTSATYYLHFSAITTTSGEGICRGTLTLGDGNTTMTNEKVYPLYNANNVHTYNVFKIKNAEGGPYQGEGSIYVVTSPDFTENVVSFVVSNRYLGLAKYNSSNAFYAEASPTSASATSTRYAFDPALYTNVLRNSTSGSTESLIFPNGKVALTTSELQGVFTFFGFSYANAGVPTDANFIGRGIFTTTAEARFNSTVTPAPPVTYPPVTVPKTGDAASGIGYTLIAVSLLALGTFGFVSSRNRQKREEA